MTTIPFCDLARAHAPIRADIEQAVRGCIDRSSFLRGPETQAFEEEWAAFCGQKYAVACNSGTDALTIAAAALGLEQARIPSTTLPLTAIGLHRAGTRVILADVDADGHMQRPCADTVPVLFYGRLPPAGHPLARLYDAAHAHGWQPSQGTTAAWSFYPTKTLGGLGDGGAVTTDDDSLARTMRDLCGRDDVLRDRRQLTSRMDEIQAAVLRVKLRHLPAWLQMRREIGERYDAWLGPAGLALPGPSLHHLYCIRVPDRDGLRSHLAERGIGSKVHWEIPLHRQDGPWQAEASLPNADRWCDTIVSLPCFPGLGADEIDRVCEAVVEHQAALDKAV